ncbi:hypothetical protein IM792_14665 [Mucilaginibacter sp. JRF]|uniref:hypothetical protein n=1 Tax=Mucilaginibacter sp. JRF TaxID=2780088 RepID=UPI001881A5A4|nr:hypothetical protein [Mucilaginibacter sp. JRF]MBE9585697.1 hypothetical protein [Mucilaginibacter sp. JRF]
MSFSKPNIRNFDYVQICLHRTYDAINEIRILSKERLNHAEVKLIEHGPLVKYARALHYVFVLEYTKLFEAKKKGESSQHLASLEKLSHAILYHFGSNFQPTHDIVIKKIDEIRETVFFKKILKDRDSKYAHSDANDINPYSFTSFDDDDIDTALHHLELIKIINSYCTSAFKFEFIFDHDDDRTDNFIVFQSKYQDFYFKNRKFSDL